MTSISPRMLILTTVKNKRQKKKNKNKKKATMKSCGKNILFSVINILFLYNLKKKKSFTYVYKNMENWNKSIKTLSISDFVSTHLYWIHQLKRSKDKNEERIHHICDSKEMSIPSKLLTIFTDVSLLSSVQILFFFQNGNKYVLKEKTLIWKKKKKKFPHLILQRNKNIFSILGISKKLFQRQNFFMLKAQQRGPQSQTF